MKDVNRLDILYLFDVLQNKLDKAITTIDKIKVNVGSKKNWQDIKASIRPHKQISHRRHTHQPMEEYQICPRMV